MSAIDPLGVRGHTTNRSEDGADGNRGARQSSHQDQARGVREPADELGVDPGSDEAGGGQRDEHGHGPTVAVVGIDEERPVRAEP